MDFHVPELGEGLYEAELVAWKVKPGDVVKPGQSLAEVLTDKASMDLPAPFAGRIDELCAEPGQTIRVGEVLLRYSGAGAEQPAATETAKTTESAPSAKAAVAETGPTAGKPVTAPAVSTGDLAVRAAPSVRLMARQLGIDLRQVRGTGPGGRILIRDLSAQVQARDGRGPAPEAAPPVDYGRPGSRIKLQGLRRKIAEHMVQAKRTIPHYSYIDECNATELVRLREGLKQRFEGSGVKLTYLPFVVKAVVAALQEVPIVNASLDEDRQEIVLHDRYDIGIATATPTGLIVPVVRNADQKSLTDIAREIQRLANAVRSKQARPEELRGSTFTITSIGSIGGLISTPVINHPEAAILGIGKLIRRPVYDDHGDLVPADLLYLSFSFDHRILDGAVGAVFANAVIRRLENPVELLLPDLEASSIR